MLDIAIIGLGARGAEVYGKYAHTHPSECRVVAIADSDPIKVEKYKAVFGLSDDVCHLDGMKLLEASKIATAVIIASPDRDHEAHALLALEKGYDILLEKPIAPTEEACVNILKQAQAHHRKVAVCHVLRYAPLFQKVKALIDEDAIGQIVHLDQVEHIGAWHFAHSFVRGNWRSKASSAPIILAKTCHDLDMLSWLSGSPCESVSSIGDLRHFKETCAPQGATKRCLDGCAVRASCPYDAEKIYIDNFRGESRWPFIVLDPYPSKASLAKAINEGPYGRCVYHSDNDVSDHQLTQIRFKNNIKASLTLTAFSGHTHRQLKIFGTKGEIAADDLTQTITIKRFNGHFDNPVEVIDINALYATLEGHGGGDDRLMKDFITYVSTDALDATHLTHISASMASHFMAFAAEASRLSGGHLRKVREE